MLHNVALVPLLLAPTLPVSGPLAPEAAPVPARDLLAALPENTFFALHVPDPKALVAARETNDWIAFAMDPEWKAISELLLTQIDASAAPGQMEQWRQRLFRGLADSTGFVVFVGEGFSSGDPALGIIAEGGPDSAALLRQFLLEDSRTVPIAGGREALVSEAGRGELYYESNGVIMVLSTPTVESATSMAAACLDALDGPAPRGPFAVAELAAERRPATIELGIDMTQLWDELERVEAPVEGIQRDMFDAVSSMEWMYGSVSIGEGETSDWEFVAPYGAETLLGGLLGHFGRADKDLLGNVPATAAGGSVLAFDVSGCADWIVEIVRETSEEAYGEMQSGLTAVTEMSGIDVMGDLVHNMSGQFLMFTSTTVLASEFEALVGMQATTVIASIEDTDPVLDMVEILIDMSGMGPMVETETAPVRGDEDGMEVWRIDPGMGFEVAVATGAGRIALSTDPSGFENYLERIAGESETKGLLSDPALASSIGSLSGAVVSVQRTAAAVEAFQSSMESIEAMLAPYGAGELGPFMDAIDRVTVLMEQYFDGTTASELQIDGERIRYRMRTR